MGYSTLVITEFGRYICQIEKVCDKYIASDGLDSRSGDTAIEARDRLSAIHFLGKELDDLEIPKHSENCNHLVDYFGGKNASEAIYNMLNPDSKQFPGGEDAKKNECNQAYLQ